ncbi:MAG TPA: hypothetical protein VN648_15180 [Candidatus Methylomirabilis sp.]|nr:hypothetical protein [Candidatus Methylomirabilis sp.]
MRQVAVTGSKTSRSPGPGTLREKLKEEQARTTIHGFRGRQNLAGA